MRRFFIFFFISFASLFFSACKVLDVFITKNNALVCFFCGKAAERPENVKQQIDKIKLEAKEKPKNGIDGKDRFLIEEKKREELQIVEVNDLLFSKKEQQKNTNKIYNVENFKILCGKKKNQNIIEKKEQFGIVIVKPRTFSTRVLSQIGNENFSFSLEVKNKKYNDIINVEQFQIVSAGSGKHEEVSQILEDNKSIEDEYKNLEKEEEDIISLIKIFAGGEKKNQNIIEKKERFGIATVEQRTLPVQVLLSISNENFSFSPKVKEIKNNKVIEAEGFQITSKGSGEVIELRQKLKEDPQRDRCLSVFDGNVLNKKVRNVSIDFKVCHETSLQIQNGNEVMKLNNVKKWENKKEKQNFTKINIKKKEDVSDENNRIKSYRGGTDLNTKFSHTSFNTSNNKSNTSFSNSVMYRDKMEDKNIINNTFGQNKIKNNGEDIKKNYATFRDGQKMKKKSGAYPENQKIQQQKINRPKKIDVKEKSCVPTQKGLNKEEKKMSREKTSKNLTKNVVKSVISKNSETSNNNSNSFVSSKENEKNKTVNTQRLNEGNLTGLKKSKKTNDDIQEDEKDTTKKASHNRFKKK